MNQSHQFTYPDDRNQHFILIVHTTKTPKSSKISPNSQRFVALTTKIRGLIFVGPCSELLNRYRTSAAKGIVETNESTRFCILIEKFSNQWVHLPKHICIAIASPALDTIYHSNLPTFDDKAINRLTGIRFNQKGTAVYPNDTSKVRPMNG